MESLDKDPGDAPPIWCIVNAEWFRVWIDYLYRDHPAPGHIRNAELLEPNTGLNALLSPPPGVCCRERLWASA